MKIFIRLLNEITPKNKKRIVFSSTNDFSGNSRAFYEYIYSNYSKFNEISWIINEKEAYKKLKAKGLKNIYYKQSLQAILKILRAKYLVSTHKSFLNIKASSQVHIEVWHGMPLKKMAYMEENIIESEENKKIDFLISTSIIMKSLMASCFNINPKKILVCGQPRNDYLFLDNKKSLSNLENVLNLDCSKYSKIMLYMPTFRHGYSDKNDGKKFEGDNIFRFEDFNMKIFDKYLSKQNILFIMKLHPFEEKLYKDKCENLKNIMFLSQEILDSELLDTYQILSSIDILITDYSSVYFDYLLLDKPIWFVVPDLDIYERERGFLLEPYEEWTPGPKIKNEEELYEVFNCLNEDKFKKERKRINAMINKYQDENSSKRVFDIVIK